jgi:hypothetical protein
MIPDDQTERQIQRAILKMCGALFPDVFIHHSPNGSKLAGSPRDRQVTGGILKGDGMKAGWPDLECLWKPGKVAYIEVKRPKIGVLNPNQKDVHARLDALGFPVATVTNEDEAYAFLKACGAPCRGELMQVAA